MSWAMDPERLGLGLITLLLAGGLIGLAREFARAARRDPPTPARNLAPADGRVGVACVSGTRGEPNRVDPRFRRFSGWDTTPKPSRGGRVADPPPLLGRVAIVSMFLGRDGRDWSDAEIGEALASLERAGRWIGRQAMARKAPVHIDLADAYFQARDDRPRGEVEVEFATVGEEGELFEAGAEVKEMAAFSKAAADLGFADASDLANCVAEALRRDGGGVDAIVWLLHPRSEGHSFVIGHREAPPGAALAVCYAREGDFPKRLAGRPFPDPATFVHELLHLFGASDKYNVPLRTFPEGSVTGRDIMRMDVESLSRLRVDPLTAREIGWSG